MKYRKKKLIIAIVVVLLAALILNAIFTWGIMFDHYGGFGSSTTSLFENIVTDGYAYVSLGGDISNLIFRIPFVFSVYGIESPPYAINIAVRDNTGLLKRCFWESVIIEYVDGQKIDHNFDWVREFNNKFSGMQEKYVIDKLPVTVDRRQSCNIRFVGYFVNKEGVKISFDTTKHFEYESHKWSIYRAAGSF